MSETNHPLWLQPTELILESPVARLEGSATEASSRLWSKDTRDGSVYAEEGLEVKLSHIGQLEFEFVPIGAPSSWNKTKVMIGEANCDKLQQTWNLINNATFRMTWYCCDRDSVLVTHAGERYMQPRLRNIDGTYQFINFTDTQNKTIFKDAFKLSWEYAQRSSSLIL
jgi:hypothetical protein